MLKYTTFFKLCVGDDNSCELLHVAQYYMRLKCCVGRLISDVCKIPTHKGMCQL
jgi:hypothetical protein